MHKDTPDSIHAEYEALVGEKLPRVLYRTRPEGRNWCICFGKDSDAEFTIGDFIGLLVDSKAGSSCRNCGTQLYRSCTEYMRLHSDSDGDRTPHFAYSETEIAEASWFHSTKVADWDGIVSCGAIESIHAGSRLAAIDRSLQNQNEVSSIYELKIVPDSDGKSAIDGFVDDLEEDWFRCPEGAVLPYVNDWEAPGATSIYAHHERLRVVGVKTFLRTAFEEAGRDIRAREVAMLAAAGIAA